MKNRPSTQGFTLIEVLIALVILAVGLLGMATLTMTSLQSSQSAYLRSQASLLASDIIERMRANRAHAVSSDDYEQSEGSTSPTAPSCSACTPEQQAERDLAQWRAALENGIPGATAAIERTGNEYQISISWAESGTSLRNADNDEVSPSFTLRVDL